MRRLHALNMVLMCLLLAACAAPVQTATRSPAPSAAPPPTAGVSAQPTATSAASELLAPTLVPPASPTNAPIVQTATGVAASPTAQVTPQTHSAGQIVLQLAAGAEAGKVGITADAGPTTFRVAADGSLRVMDAVNKRLLFFNGSTGKLEQTIDLSFLQQPTDFVVTGNGDLYVLDVGGWTIDHLSINSKELNNIPLNPALNGKFRTISLTADGRVMGLDGANSHVLITTDGPLSFDDQARAEMPGTVTVRSDALFGILADAPEPGEQQLSIGGGVAVFDLGKLDGKAAFLDVNQGMEPYVTIDRNGVTEVQRYSVNVNRLGTLMIDQQACRPMLRSLYVDRPGDVYAMCGSGNGAIITRYTMTDNAGQPLPRFDQLVQSAPWSPGNLQAAPG